MLDQQLTRPEKEPEEAAGNIFSAQKGLEMAIKYMYQIDVEDSVIIMCTKLENELYRLTAVGGGGGPKPHLFSG
jgi:hypothetical protein